MNEYLVRELAKSMLSELRPGDQRLKKISA